MARGWKMSAEARRRTAIAGGKSTKGIPKKDRQVYTDTKLKLWAKKRQEAWDADDLGRRGFSDISAKMALAENKGDCCHKCEQSPDDWQGQFLMLELHHIDGNRYNNKRDNLQLLCPNCHSQTDSHYTTIPKYHQHETKKKDVQSPRIVV